jgi:transposase
MSRTKLVVEGATPEEIHNLLRKDEKYMVGVRLYAVYQVSQGKISRDLEYLYDVSFKSIYNWVHAFNVNGVEGLKDKPGRGRRSRLEQEELQALKTLITNEEPVQYGYNTSTWTGPILIDFVEKKYDVKYKKAQIYNIMKSLGLSFQKAKGTYPEKDEKKREEFVDS